MQPEPTEASRVTDEMIDVFWNDRRFRPINRKAFAEMLEKALAVAPGCRGAELALVEVQIYAESAQLDDLNEYEALNHVARLCREALAAFRASGKPDYESPGAEVREVLRRWKIGGMFGGAFFDGIDERWNERDEEE